MASGKMDPAGSRSASARGTPYRRFRMGKTSPTRPACRRSWRIEAKTYQPSLRKTARTSGKNFWTTTSGTTTLASSTSRGSSIRLIGILSGSGTSGGNDSTAS
eukprot:3928516-Pyramimonas_sp.AAC.1